MNFRSFRLKQFLLYLLPALTYPLYVWISSEPKSKLLKFIDALTIMAFVFLVIGIIYSLVYHGDFDITEYVAKRSLRKGDVKSYEAFKEDKRESRKDRFNYPFCICILLFVAAGLLTVFVY